MFATTRWSLVRVAGEGDSPSARQALAELCGRYWYAAKVPWALGALFLFPVVMPRDWYSPKL
jgi:hypothetical protein